MTVRVMKIRDDMGSILEMSFDIAKAARDAGRYTQICDGKVYDAYLRAVENNLRYDRKTNVMRDNRLGELSRPSNPSEWSEATANEAREYMARQVWCDAVRVFNVENMLA
jgi:hypothetical protein